MNEDTKVQTGAERPLPPNAGKGRPKGVPNKTTKALKDMILGALEQKGGEEYLMKQADENPTAFLTLIGKVLPTTLAGDKDNPLTFTTIERRIVRSPANPDG